LQNVMLTNRKTWQMG